MNALFHSPGTACPYVLTDADQRGRYAVIQQIQLYGVEDIQLMHITDDNDFLSAKHFVYGILLCGRSG